MNFNLNSEEYPCALNRFEERTGHVFQNRALLMEALTHPSYAVEAKRKEQNQRLEYLGDAVLQIILTEYLYKQLPQEQEGILSRMRAHLVNEAANSSYARRLGLDELLLLGHGECQNGGRKKDSILGDLFEAYLGARYLEAGLEDCRAFVLALLPDLKEVQGTLELDDNPKGSLIVLCQGLKLGTPVYEVVSTTGPVHCPEYTVSVRIQGREYSKGKGRSKKEAEQHGAREAYLTLEKEMKTDATKQAVVALDFDGVVCDSVVETCRAGWRGARKIWPELFVADMPDEETIEGFRKVRPWLETGFEAILLNKMLQEKLPFLEFSQNLRQHYDRILAENNLTNEKLKAVMGATRDEWIQQDLKGWCGSHGFYPGVLDALKRALENPSLRVLIITTKQERFVQEILKSAGMEFPAENLFGLDRGKKKTQILAEVLEEHPASVDFVEDRLQTLLNVEALDNLKSVRLHYAKWGYGTSAHLECALHTPRIHVIGLEDFSALFGL